jgi:hypothetical protein
MGGNKQEKELKITKEILEKVLYLDCRKEDDVRRLEKSLMKLPMIKSKEDLGTDKLETIIKKIEIKFAIHLSYIMRSVVDCEDHYSGMIKHQTGTWLKTIYGKTINEVLGKSLFFMYFYIEDERRKMKNRKG